MDLQDKKYDAFISYRHANLDKFVAETLHKQLERFKIPKQIRKDKGLEKKDILIFRDQDELPLSSNLAEPITEALKNSEYLILICTPRLLESEWCKREIETFIEFHKKEHIFTVLAEGEPEDSFPKQLLYNEVEELDDTGNKVIRVKSIEPLAADVRGENFKQVKKKIKREKLRILAPMFGLGYDDLKQRHKEQKMKRALSISAIIATFLLAFCIVSTLLALEIKKQSDQIMEQNNLITVQNDDISAKNHEIVEQSVQIQKQFEEAQMNYSKSLADASTRVLGKGDRMAAIYIARKGLPSNIENPEIPYTTECEYALTNAMYVYNGEQVFRPYNIYSTDSKVIDMKVSQDGKRMLVIDSSDQIYVWDTQTHLLLAKVQGIKYMDKNVVQLFGNNKFVYPSFDGTYIYDLVTGDINCISKEQNTIIPYPDGDRYLEISFDKMVCYSTSDNTICFEKKESTFYLASAMNFFFSEDKSKIIILNEFSSKQGLYVIDAMTGELLYNQKLTFRFASLNYCNGKALVVSYDKKDEDNKYIYTLTCIDLNSYETLWEKTEDEVWFNNIRYTKIDEQEYYFLQNSWELYTYNARTGELLNLSESNQKIVNSYVLNDGCTQLMICEDGTLLTYDVSTSQLMDISMKIDYTDYKSEDCIWNKGTLYIQPQEGSQIIVYKMLENSKAVESASLSNGDSYGTINTDGTLVLTSENQEEKNWIILKEIKTGEIIAKIEDTLGYSQYFFVGNGLDEFAICGRSCTVYDVKDGKVLRTIEIDDFYTIEGHSFDGKLLYVVPYSNQEPSKAYSIETGNLIMKTPEVELGSEITTIYANNQSVLACCSMDKDEVRLYHPGEEKAYLTRQLRLTDVRKIFFTEDGNYLCIIDCNGNPSFYSTQTMELVKMIYDIDMGTPYGIEYLEEIHKYLVLVSGGGFLLDENFNLLGTIPDYHSFDAKNQNFLYVDIDSIYTIPYYSYDTLIKSADELLQGYEISDELKRKYNVE